MSTNDHAQASAAVTPSDVDVARARQVILGVLGEIAPGSTHTVNLIDKVRERFALEPLPAGAAKLQEVADDAYRKAWAVAAALTALAELQWTGQVLPVDHLEAISIQIPELQLVNRSGNPVRDLRPEYMFPIGTQLRIAAWLRPPRPDALALLRVEIPDAQEKVTYVLREAAESYHRGLFLAAAMLIGIASEAAWLELAEVVLDRTSDAKLRSLLAGQRAQTAKTAERVVVLLRGLLPREEWPEYMIQDLAEREAFRREIRDYAAHKHPLVFDAERFSQARVGELLASSVDYFQTLYLVIDLLRG